MAKYLKGQELGKTIFVNFLVLSVAVILVLLAAIGLFFPKKNPIVGLDKLNETYDERKYGPRDKDIFNISKERLQVEDKGKGLYQRFQKQMLMAKDPNLGHANRPNSSVKDEMIKDGKFIYKAQYNIDDKGRRKTKKHIEKQSFVALFGGEFVFGKGLNDDQTLSSMIEKYSTKHNAYNYGLIGAGTNHMLAMVKSKDFKGEIQQSEGVWVYVYDDNHLRRTIGANEYLDEYPDAPWYVLDGDEVLRIGSMKGRNALIKWAYDFANRFDLKVPPFVSVEHVKLTCELVEDSKEKFLKNFPNSKYVVLFHPLGEKNLPSKDYNYRGGLKDCLKSKTIEYLEYNKLYTDTPLGKKDELFIDYTEYPSMKGNEELAKKIVEALEGNAPKE
ncbi:MAG: hypothetical protein KC493_09915 [Bacteriovoracaceae bacterium]|nr:hypothetical protein [Bacteriovoracaceae bacterium]